VLIECANCGAPLDVPQGRRRTKCGYCGAPQQVGGSRTLAMERPPGWQPPRQWTPPAHFPERSVPLQFDASAATQAAGNAARKVVLVSVIGVALIGLIPAIVIPIVMSQVSSAVERSTPASPQMPQIPQMPHPTPNVPGGGTLGAGGGAISVQTEPIECVGAGTVVRMNEEIRVTGPTAVVVRGTCHLRLINCTVGGNQGMDVRDQGRVEMVNGALRAEGGAVRTSGQANVQLTNVEVTAAEGVEATGSSTIRMLNGSMDVDGVALAARDGSHVTTQNTTLSGRVERDSGATVMVDGERRDSDPPGDEAGEPE